MHLRRRGPGDAATAEPLLASALEQVEALGMTGWLRRARELEANLTGS